MILRKRKAVELIMGVILAAAAVMFFAVRYVWADEQRDYTKNIRISLDKGTSDEIAYKTMIDRGSTDGSLGGGDWVDGLGIGLKVYDVCWQEERIPDLGANTPSFEETFCFRADAVGVTPHLYIKEPVREGYIFDGWEISQPMNSWQEGNYWYVDIGIWDMSGNTNYEDLTLTAKWREDTSLCNQTVYASFQDEEGKWGEWQTVVNGTYRCGTQCEWKYEEDEIYQEASIAYTVHSENVNYIKVYRKKGSITLYGHPGVSEVTGSGEYYVGQDIVIHADVGDGYQFFEWRDDMDSIAGSTQTLTYTVESGRKTFYAYAKPNTYFIQFDKNGPIEATEDIQGDMDSLLCTYGQAYHIPECTYQLTGWVFRGWNTCADGSGTQYESRQELLNVTTQDKAVIKLYAQWSNNHYIVSYNDNGGCDGPGDVDMAYDVSYEISDAPVRCGFTFVEWNTKADGSGDSYLEGDMVKNLTPWDAQVIPMYAIWKRNRFDLIKVASTMHHAALVKRTENDQQWFDKVGRMSVHDLNHIETSDCIRSWVIDADGEVKKVK